MHSQGAPFAQQTALGPADLPGLAPAARIVWQAVLLVTGQQSPAGCGRALLHAAGPPFMAGTMGYAAGGQVPLLCLTSGSGVQSSPWHHPGCPAAAAAPRHRARSRVARPRILLGTSCINRAGGRSGCCSARAAREQGARRQRAQPAADCSQPRQRRRQQRADGGSWAAAWGCCYMLLQAAAQGHNQAKQPEQQSWWHCSLGERLQGCPPPPANR